MGKAVLFVRVGTLDHPEKLPPEINIYTSTKQPWLTLPSETPAFEAYYKMYEVWSEESLKRIDAL